MTTVGEKEKALRYLEDYFLEDERAMEAIRFLRERIRESSSKSPRVKGRFPLPPEVEGQKGVYVLFSDGACRGNPGPGAWGAMGQDCRGGVLFESNGMDLSTTNNRMELEGAIVALEELERHLSGNGETSPRAVFLYSDSKYVVDGITLWVNGWKRRGWKKKDNTTPLNVDLWQRLEHIKGKFPSLTFRWVKGHSGHPQNDHVDKLANKALDESEESLLR